MNQPRVSRLAAVGCMLVLTLLLPATASAAKPVINHFEWQDAPEFFADCQAWGYGDYMIVGQSDGFGTEKLWFDKDGNLVRVQVFLHIDDTIINTGTEQTWRDIGR